MSNPRDVPPFMGAQLLGAALGVVLDRMWPPA